MKAEANGKIILSGEYSVLFGAPALVIPSDEKLQITLSRHSSDDFELEVTSHDLMQQYTDHCLDRLKTSTSAPKSILDVVAYLVISILEKLRLKINKKLKIEIKSSIPIGCGMGSSAALIVAILKAIRSFLKIYVPNLILYPFARQLENIFHMHSSGVDVACSLYSQPLIVQNSKFKRIKNLSLPKIEIINTGKPLASTADCVKNVSDNFSKSQIWSEFEDVTNVIQSSFIKEDNKKIKEYIRYNHRLLCEIGIVPEYVKDIIEDIENKGGAAKVCGAGSIKGNSAGIIMKVAA